MRSFHRSTAPIVLAYACFGIAYILTSDRIVDSLGLSAAQVSVVQSYKGIGFILVTAALLYILILGAMSRQRRALDHLRESEQIRRAIADHAGIGVIQWDLDARCVYVNQTWLEQCGQSLEQTLGEGWINKCWEAVGVRSRTDWLAMLKGADKFEEIVPYTHASGATKVGKLIVSPIRFGDRSVGWVGTLDDVTTMVDLNAELERRVAASTEELKESNENLAAFAYSAAHDLRSPLRATAGFATILKEEATGELNEEARVALERILANTDHMNVIIDDLLAMSQATSGELKRENFDLTTLANQVIGEEMDAVKDRTIEFDVVKGLTVQADPRFVEILLHNLVANAIKFTREREVARIAIEPMPNDDNGFRIKDNGAGFSEADGKRMFRAFQRGSEHARFGGTGIGLFTADRIVRKHGGFIRAIGKPDEGATFEVCLGTPH